jgi:protein SCO1
MGRTIARQLFAVLLIALSLLFEASSLPAKMYSASGLVLRVDRAHLSLEVSCQAIPGYMDAAVMTLPVRNGQALDGLEPGTMVDFKLAVEGKTLHAEEIRVYAYENTAQEPMAARQLEILDAATSAPSRRASSLQIGQAGPDFTLTDQKRETIRFSKFAGKVVAITFVYTRCPLPNFCFRMSNNFGVLHQRSPVAWRETSCCSASLLTPRMTGRKFWRNTRARGEKTRPAGIS